MFLSDLLAILSCQIVFVSGQMMTRALSRKLFRLKYGTQCHCLTKKQSGDILGKKVCKFKPVVRITPIISVFRKTTCRNFNVRTLSYSGCENAGLETMLEIGGAHRHYAINS